MPACDWVLIDTGDIIVHIFRPEVRQFYNLEKMWAPTAPMSGSSVDLTVLRSMMSPENRFPLFGIMLSCALR